MPVEGGQPKFVAGSKPGDIPLRWTKDGQSLLIGIRSETESAVVRLHLQSGVRTPWKAFSASDVAGLTGSSAPLLAADEEHYVFGYVRNLSDLFLVEHLQ